MLLHLSQAKLQPYHQSAAHQDEAVGPIKSVTLMTHSIVLNSLILTLKFEEEPEALLGC